ncbi:MAG: hypothetical protein B7Z74_07265, partial [Deltaproteobacteria bacterium 21-66-5]
MTTYTDTALARNTSYRYRVFAFNMAGSSPASNVTPSVTTGTFPDATGVTLTPSLSSPQVIGTAVNFVAAATGGTGNYQYEFQDITGGGNTLVQAYGVNPTYRWYTDGLAAGTYSFRVNARCVGTTTAVTATVTFTLGVATPNTVALTSSLPSPQFSGTSVTFTATASGGLGTYEYQFSDNVSGSMTVVQPYSASSAFVWNTTSVPAGTYQFQVTARNAGSTSAAEATSTPLPFTLQAPIGATLTVSPPSPQPSGYYLAFVAVASGGSGTYEYQFSDNVSGAMTVVQPYSSSAAFVWNSTGVANGTYQFKVDVRNAGSTSPSQATASTNYAIIGVAGAPATGVSLSATPASPQPPGTSVAFLAAGSGGTGTYEYQFSDNVTGAMAVTRAYSQSSN